jgi:cold shock CspA family protein
MQATVLTFDPTTSTGTIVADTGTTMAFGAQAFAVGGLRLLRPGQRVRVARSEAGDVESITVSTLALPSDAERDRA